MNGGLNYVKNMQKVEMQGLLHLILKNGVKNAHFILSFKQIPAKLYPNNLSMHEPMSNCILCGKLIYSVNPLKDTVSRLCSDCYLISSGWINSLYKNPILVIYLPWWNISDRCVFCELEFKFISDCQKWCTHCCIVYPGCRYCLTTNIIFGLPDRSQCRKCRRILVISAKNITSGNNDIDALLYDGRFNIKDYHKITNDISSIDVTNPLNVYDFIRSNIDPESVMEWIPYSQIRNLEELLEGGFGIIYKAIWFNGGIHKTYYETDYNTYYYKFVRRKNEIVALKSYRECFSNCVLRCYGVTKDPNSDECMLIMQYAREGNLHDYLQKKFVNIKWWDKMQILFDISNGLKAIHNTNLTHRDFHSGNILLGVNYGQRCRVGDLGLSQPANKTSLNDEIYGVIPYVAPEIFNGATFSKASDIYSFGMIMWECTTGCKPFADIEHDHTLIYKILNGERPKITDDTPECFATLIKRCWSPDPMKRPDIAEVYEAFRHWYFMREDAERFMQAEKKRLEIVQSKLLGPEFAEKHPKTIYTSRSLSSLISKASSINSTVSFNTKKVEYISREYELDNIQSSSSTNVEELNIDTQDTQDNGK
ncbi:kinase-like domain-containing protein [Glomus cerebriforme]|uniref:Kinase-like domain-containing protein n=1 Tax=Glomus cerebriforme TaxID=658196 RepID=A0A397S4W4_9GLOM|nr:kinase-like domain-containing protein [Glomus cerebriforme]